MIMHYNIITFHGNIVNNHNYITNIHDNIAIICNNITTFRDISMIIPDNIEIIGDRFSANIHNNGVVYGQ